MGLLEFQLSGILDGNDPVTVGNIAGDGL